MHPIPRTLRRGLFALSLISALAACGGGSSPVDGAKAFAARIAQQDMATQRKQALAVGDPVDAKALLDWVEFKFPTLFARGPASFSLDFAGATYTIRAYAHAGGTRFVGVTNGGEVYGLGDFTGEQLQRFGTLSDFAAQINADSCNVYPGSCPAAVAGLPADLVGRPAHPDCAALRSGPYRWLNPAEGDPAWNTFVGQFDAPTGRLTLPDASVVNATSTGNCTFSSEGGRTRMVVSPAGVIVITSFANQQVISLAFPEQQGAIADLAGLSNFLGYAVYDSSPTGKRWRTDFGTTEFDASGVQTALSDCAGRSACVADNGALGSLRANPAGGFDLVVPGRPKTMRVFAYKPASGDAVWFGIEPDQLIVSSRQKSLPLPAVGDPLPIWTIESNWTGTAAAGFTDTSGSVTAVDATARTYTRTLDSGRVDLWNLDVPRNGLRYRVGTANSSELLNMPLPGLGMSVYGAVVGNSALSGGFFGIGVNK
jgi:hypothetical protein